MCKDDTYTHVSNCRIALLTATAIFQSVTEIKFNRFNSLKCSQKKKLVNCTKNSEYCPLFRVLDVCVTVHHQYKDVNNQQDATTFSFINLFKSALHVSGDKFAHPQELF